jgi:predicted TIM-barrel fold metal-dependent hydrolase
MLPHFDKLNIIKGVVLPGGVLLPYIPGNEECEAIYRADPEHFAWMCSPEPLNPDTVYETLKGYKDRGAVGVGELTVNLPMTDPALSALFEAAGKLSMPITLHMSPEVGCSYGVVDAPGLPLLEECLRRFPDTVFVGHSACFWCEISSDPPTVSPERNGYPKTPVLPGGRIPELLEKYPNLYCDLSATSGGQAILRDEAHGLHFLERFADRMIFATDMENVGAEYPLYSWLDQMAEEGKLSMEAYRKICCENAKRLYQL